MGKTDIKMHTAKRLRHTDEYIHIKTKTVLNCIIFLIAFGILYGLDIILINAPDVKLNIEFILGLQAIAVLLAVVSYIYAYFDSEGNFYG
jgi:uncharacterized MnhB-related membrane protein